MNDCLLSIRDLSLVFVFSYINIFFASRTHRKNLTVADSKLQYKYKLFVPVSEMKMKSAQVPVVCQVREEVCETFYRYSPHKTFEIPVSLTLKLCSVPGFTSFHKQVDQDFIFFLALIFQSIASVGYISVHSSHLSPSMFKIISQSNES